MSPFSTYIGAFVNRTDRLYAIVEELRVAGPAGRTARWLAERFGVSVRTIKRDMATLEEAGTPVWATDGRNGGYRIQRAAALPPLAFTSGEATAVAIALAAEPDLPFGSDGRNALAKVLGAMSDVHREAARGLGERIFMRVPTRSAPLRWTNVLDESLRACTVVKLSYRDRRGTLTRGRSVEPLAFARTGGHWYLLAWCRRSGEGRWFRMDRLVAAYATRERFGPRDLDEVFGEAPPDAQPVRL